MEPRTKHFKKREAILECLRSTDSHPTAEWVHVRLGTVNGVERFDANTEPHVHFICNGCHRVDDLPEMEIPAALCGAADRYSGGHAEICHLSFTGTCRECLTK